MFLQLALLPPLGHKKAIGTLGYPIASKLKDLLGLGHSSVDKHTHTGLYNIDATSFGILPQCAVSLVVSINVYKKKTGYTVATIYCYIF